MAVVAPALITPEYFASTLQARNKFGALAVLRLCQIAVPGTLMIFGVLLGQLIGAMTGFIAGSLIVGVTCLILWRKVHRFQDAGIGGERIPWKYVFLTNLTLIVLFLSYRIDVLILNAASSAHEVGVYSAGVAVAELVLVVAMSAAVVRAPFYARHPMRPLRRDAWLVLGLSAFTAFSIAAICPLLVTTLFGPEYQGAIPTIWILLPGISILAVYRFVSNAELVRGHKLGILYSCLISIACDVTLVIILSPNWGALGAAAAGSISYAAGLGYLLLHRSLRGAPRFKPGVHYASRSEARLPREVKA
ncbi:hypothetical protein GU243_10950 [Pseudarthrobacter psychrotolerans]|uniref:Uncharacterized protein n=1 Tax=Pseudarthrobacter psychrotolerans TaxID=2697569 RepID=A0A6P1NNR0_9MICC|nr:polysaccharide biosynthesis C-terminal domain-containing protein [Pseudarthrobacter psychrotolerans]QHK20164.1 hypothetical protein GU243_10950 [Pseudarthrobacter psychrotolerans]